MSGLQKDAKITIGVDGADDVARAADRALTPWQKGMGTIEAGAGKIRDSFKDAVSSTVSDIGHVVTAVSTISFGAAVMQVRAFEDATARMGIAANRDIGGLREGFDRLSKATGEKSAELQAWASGVGKLTYDYGSALEAARGLNAEAVANGRALADYAQLGVELHNTLGVTGDTAEALGKIRAQADLIGTTGGPAALADQIVGLQGTLSQLGITTDEQRNKITGLAAALGKGLSPEASGRVQQKVIGDIANDPRGYERFLGEKAGALTDEYGHMKDPVAVAERVQQKLLKRAGGDLNKAQFLGEGVLGREASAALVHMDFDDVRAAQKVAPSHVAEERFQSFLKTDAGKRLQAAAARQRAIESDFGGDSAIGSAVDYIQQATADHPILSTLGVGAAVKTGGKLVSGVLGKVIGGGEVAGAGSSAAGAAEAAEGSAAAGSGAAVGAVALPAAVTALYGGAWVKAANELAGARPQIAGEMSSQFEGQRAHDVQGLVTAAARSGGGASPEAFMKSAGPGLMQRTDYDPGLRQIASGLVNGKVDAGGLDPSLVSALTRALENSKLQITVVNGTGGPIQAVDGARAGKAQQ